MYYGHQKVSVLERVDCKAIKRKRPCNMDTFPRTTLMGGLTYVFLS